MGSGIRCATFCLVLPESPGFSAEATIARLPRRPRLTLAASLWRTISTPSRDVDTFSMAIPRGGLRNLEFADHRAGEMPMRILAVPPAGILTGDLPRSLAVARSV